VRSNGKTDQVTDTPNPARFQIGSAASRAMARVLLEERKRNGRHMRLQIVSVGHPDDMPLPQNERAEWEGGSTEVIYSRS
jgi:hypothetical protein